MNCQAGIVARAFCLVFLYISRRPSTFMGCCIDLRGLQAVPLWSGIPVADQDDIIDHQLWFMPEGFHEPAWFLLYKMYGILVFRYGDEIQKFMQNRRNKQVQQRDVAITLLLQILSVLTVILARLARWQIVLHIYFLTFLPDLSWACTSRSEYCWNQDIKKTLFSLQAVHTGLFALVPITSSERKQHHT